MRIAILRLLGGILCLTGAATAGAQQAPKPDDVLGSRYLSMENAGYDAIAQLLKRGLLTTLDPLAQPYHRIDIARALVNLNPDTLRRPISDWVRQLRKEMAPELARLAGRDSVQLGFEMLGSMTASTSRSLTPILPYYDTTHATIENRSWPAFGLGGWAEVGRFALESRFMNNFYIDGWNGNPGGDQRGDPYGIPPGGDNQFRQNDDAYLSVSYSLGTFFVGRMARNWAPVGDTGLMISNNPTTYPQIGFDISSRGFTLRFMAGELDTAGGQYTGEPRFITANEVEYRKNDFAISVGEAMLAVSPSGLPFAALNPLEILYLESNALPEEPKNNTELNGALWLRHGPATFYGEAMMDYVRLSDPTHTFRGALSGGVQYQPSTPWVDFGVDARMVSAYAYWMADTTDQWTTYGRGLGDNFSDYGRLTFHSSLYPDIQGLRLTPTIELQEKGEGDFRASLAQFNENTSPDLFLGVKETTVRAALAGRYDPTNRVYVSWDGGVNFTTNANHQSGRNLAQFEGVVSVGFTWSTPGVRPQ